MNSIKEFFRKYKKPILIVLAVILILIIVIFSISWGEESEEIKPTSTIRGTEIMEQPTIIKGEITKKEKETSNASVVAKNFAEIYGSYSNQSNFVNLENSLPLLSKRYKAEVSQILSQKRATYEPAEEYKGTTTRSINVFTDTIDETADRAVIIVKTQRKESVGLQSNYTIKYQDIRLNMIKEGDNWLVDNSQWQ